jgi:hypothetical protein
MSYGELDLLQVLPSYCAVFGNDHCVCAETHMKPMLEIYSDGKTQGILKVTAGVTYSWHCALNG